MDDIRRNTARALAALGCENPSELPALDPIVSVRQIDEVRGRCLALYGAVAAAFGLDRSVASRWLDVHGLRPWVTPDESEFIEQGLGDASRFRGMIEALWALAWVIGVVPKLDWKSLCSNDFIRCFPDPRGLGIESPVASATRVRDTRELAEALDTAYALHHCHVVATLSRATSPGGIPATAVIARRHALEWTASSARWEDVELDT